MSEMRGPEGSAYPWLAERGDTSSIAESDYVAESGNGSSPEATADAGSDPGSDAGTEFVLPDGAEALVVSDSTPSMNDSGREPAVPFLQSLIDAMRKIADQTRDDALGKLRAAVAERAAAIRADTEKRAAELHELADGDLAGVASWEQGEIQRIRDEAATKVTARNATLDAQLAANVAAGEGAMTAVEARVEAFEAEMTSFFAQLNDIHDPAALASALKRIPTPPSLTEPVAAPAGDTAPSPAVAAAPEPAAAAAPAVSAEPDPAPPAPSEAAAPAAPAPEASSQVDADGEATAPSSVAVATAPAQAEEPAAEPGAAEPMAAEAATEPAGVTETPAAASAESTEEATTQVLVTGLTSFGAITSFKQSLERVEGINRVSLGLGTSGEFIFTAVHRAGFDLSAAIRSFEESAQFAASNGQLRVTVGSKA